MDRTRKRIEGKCQFDVTYDEEKKTASGKTKITRVRETCSKGRSCAVCCYCIGHCLGHKQLMDRYLGLVSRVIG